MSLIRFVSVCLSFAAKVWGSENDNPILALHGWQDNCGTFDRLIPLLPPDFYVVCLDFCGGFILLCAITVY